MTDLPMRHLSKTNSSRERTVGVATELISSFGRSILLGVIHYANLQRNWVLHADIWEVGPESWPECDGVIMGGVSMDNFAHFQKHTSALVSCSANFNPDEIPVITLDNEFAGAMAADHLIERGLKNFGFYGPTGANDYPLAERPSNTFKLRARGFQQTLKNHGYRWNSTEFSPVFRDLLTQSHHPRIIEWLRSLPKPIGIFAVDDSLAQDLAKVCRKGNLRVPDDVAIIGVNNDQLLCESASPSLTSIECNFTRMGYLAAKTLDRLMRGERLKPEERLIEIPPVRVQPRMSTDIVAVEQPEVAEAIRFIRQHACDPCTVTDVLDVVPVSRRTLERQFNQHLGRSLHDEIARVQIETAQRLLLQPDLKVEEIGERCGFAALQSFNRCFRRITGTTPAAYRRASIRQTNERVESPH